MGNAIIARLAPDLRSLRVVESPYPRRNSPEEGGIGEGSSSNGGGHGGRGSSIDTREAPMPQHQPWSDFTAAKLLPSSVYLWACDEPQPEGNRPSRADASVAWIILITQMICYSQLIVVSSTELSDDSSSSSTIEGHYSLVSVAAAMYLMTSIAAADLGAGIALISEARIDMATKRWVQRKMFGFMLLTSFLLLAAASIMVLFKTSSEDVDLVVGAATVLFIADVDEKVMVVLKVIPSKWRLFWVLEVISLSGALALLGLRATGSGSNVSEHGHAGCTHENADGVEGGCSIYGWGFILNHHPLSVTVMSLLVNTIVASPKEFMKKYIFGNGSACFLVSWILLTLLFYPFWGVAVTLLFVSVYAIGFGCRWLSMYNRSLCCRGSNQSNTGCVNFRWTSSTRFGLIYVPAGLFLVDIALNTLAIKLDFAWSEFDNLDPKNDWFVVPEVFYFSLFDMWLLWCICRGGNNSPERPLSPETTNTVVTENVMIAWPEGHGSVIESHEEGSSHKLCYLIFLGWVQCHALWASYGLSWDLLTSYIDSTGNRWPYLALFATFTFAWTLAGICTATSSTKGVAFWTVATYMLDTVITFIIVWILGDGSVKLTNF